MRRSKVARDATWERNLASPNKWLVMRVYVWNPFFLSLSCLGLGLKGTMRLGGNCQMFCQVFLRPGTLGLLPRFLSAPVSRKETLREGKVGCRCSRERTKGTLRCRQE